MSNVRKTAISILVLGETEDGIIKFVSPFAFRADVCMYVCYKRDLPNSFS